MHSFRLKTHCTYGYILFDETMKRGDAQMTLTQDDIERYAPYHTLPAFEGGYRDYLRGLDRSPEGVDGQAYDRGAECAMRHQREHHNQAAAILATSYRESANTEKRLASHSCTARERKRHLDKARRLERKVNESLATIIK